MKTYEFTKKALDVISQFRALGVEKYDEYHKESYREIKFNNKEISSLAISVRMPLLDFCKPPVEFEKKHGLKGISHNYKIPAGLTSQELQIYTMITLKRDDIAKSERKEKLLETYNLLISLNPILNEVKKIPDNVNDLYHLILGVASSFNIDDINQFVFNSTPSIKGLEMEQTPEFKKLSKVFNMNSCAMSQRLGIPHLGWLASPKTLNDISNKMLEQKLIKSGDHPMIKRNFPEAGF